MMKKVITVSALLLFLFSVNASLSQINDLMQSEPGQFEYKSFGKERLINKNDVLLAQEKIVRPYDVLNYEIFFDWYGPFIREIEIDENNNYDIDKSWNGINKIKLVVTEDDLNSIELDAPFLDFTKIIVNGEELQSIEYKKFESVKEIPLEEPAKTGDTINIEIHYDFSGDHDIGFFLYPGDLYVGYSEYFDDSVYTEERIAYTHCEPQDARYWYPCNDHPHDKAIFKVHIRLPNGFNAVSNGLLTEIGEYDQNSTVFTWDHAYPMSTYLLAIHASKFKIFNDYYKKVTNPDDSIEVVYYVWQKDYDEEVTDGSRYNARYAVRNMIPMMEYFSGLFIEYPFEKYGMAAVQPYRWGGMEHQSITSINRSWLRGFSDGGIAHELVHHWIGDLMTCDSWADLWVNEGGATWGEALWSLYWGGENAYNNTMLSKRYGYLYYSNTIFRQRVYDLPANNLFSYSLTYCKPAWIYHMLYKMMGKDVFLPILRNMMRDYSFQTISSEEFKDYIKNSIQNPPEEIKDIIEAPPLTIDEYFDQWLYSPGHPVFEMSVNIKTNKQDKEKYDVSITLEQIQDYPDVPDVFKVPLNFHIADLSGSEPEYIDFKVFVDERIQTFTKTFDFMPDTVIYDPTYALAVIDTTYYQYSSVQDNDLSSELFIYPNPVIIGNEIKIRYTAPQNTTIAYTMTDMLGNEVYAGRRIDPGEKITSINTNGLSSGIYYINFTAGKNIITKKITLIR
mgnify:CR=1 FL=1